MEDAFVASERFSATNFVSFPGREFLHTVPVQRACGDLGDEATRSGTRAAARRRRPTHLRDLDSAQAYGLRLRSADLWYASAYEFVTCREMAATRVPYSWQAWQALPADAWDVNLTGAGAKKLENANKVAHLKPGADYTNKFNSKPNCEYFANCAAQQPCSTHGISNVDVARSARASTPRLGLGAGQRARSTTQLCARRIFVLGHYRCRSQAA